MNEVDKITLPPISFIFSSGMALVLHKRIHSSLASFVGKLIKAYTREERTHDDEMLLGMLAKGHFIVNDIEDENRGWQCVICNHTQVRERMSKRLPFKINFYVQGMFKG